MTYCQKQSLKLAALKYISHAILKIFRKVQDNISLKGRVVSDVFLLIIKA